MYFVFDPAQRSGYALVTFTKLGARWATRRRRFGLFGRPAAGSHCDWLPAADFYAESAKAAGR